MTKQKVMEALLDASSNVPSDIISYVGVNLGDTNTEKTVTFDHSMNTVWEACGIVEQDVKDFTRAINDHMNSLPSDQREKSRGVEFVMTSGNQKWMTIVTVMGLQAASSSDDSDLKSLLAKVIEMKLKGRLGDDE